IGHVDARALTRRLRDRGVMRAVVFCGAALPAGAMSLGHPGLGVLIDLVRQAPQMTGAALAGEVSTQEAYVVEPSGEFAGREPVAEIVAVDLGIKARTPAQLAERGARVHVVPQHTTLAEIVARDPDGVCFSIRPRDPAT